MFKIFNCHYSKFCSKAHIKNVTEFHLDMPQLISGYNDKIIPRYLQRTVPTKNFVSINDDCGQFALKLENEWFYLHKECERNAPYLEHNDAWGRKIDRIVTCDAWKCFKQISSKEGLIALPFENLSVQYSRVHQCIKLMMFAPLSGLYSCPLAMTDGAAYVIEKFGRPPSLSDAFGHLTSRDPHLFWTSGQWMTEKKGGSDVADATETVAVYDREAGCHRLYGYKWFCSATDADMAFTLARSLDKDGVPIPGSKGLSMYYIETKSRQGSNVNPWNNLSVVSLKDKLGTRQLPTAEIILEGSEAIKMCEDGRGVASISGMLTITRIHNAIAAVSAMRRITLLAIEYAKKRVAFGSTLIRKPLHASTLARMDIESRAAFYFLMDVVQLLGLQENRMAADEDSAVLRILSPLLKLFTAKQAMSVVSEGLECFGGQGFIEGTGLPGMLRDAQVLPIWEGTTNVLSLDGLRSFGMGSKDAHHKSGHFHHLSSRCKKKIDATNEHLFPEIREKLTRALDSVDRFLISNAHKPDVLQLYSRYISFSVSKIYMGVLLLENASAPGADQSDEISLQSWMMKDLLFGLGENASYITDVNWDNFFG